MGFSAYAEYDGLGLAQLVAAKKVKPSELMDEAIARADRLNPKLNAIVFTDYQRARAEASARVPKGSFTGVPFLIKDIAAATKGYPSRQGSRYLPAVPAPHDSFLVAKFRAAGLIPFGTTNVPEFGLVASTESKLYGAAHNPWNSDYSVGGSSGGSAAAVAAGIVPLAHANDGGGSIRIPASVCGLVGLKPSRGRLSQGPDFADALDGIATDLVVSRSVRDTAAVLDAVRGYMPGDPYAEPPGPESFLEASKRKPKRLRIAVSLKKLDNRPLHAEAVAAAKHAAKLCEQLGHVVEEVDSPVDYANFMRAFNVFWKAGLAAGLNMIAEAMGQPPTRQLLEGVSWATYQLGKDISASEYLAAKHSLNATSRELAHFHETFDVWLTPTLERPPERLGVFDFDNEDLEVSFAPQLEYVPFTPLQNLTGTPAINVPLYWTAKENLPVGVQFAGRLGDEETLLRLATQLEKAQPWFHRYGEIKL